MTNQFKVLSDRDHVILRPSMYIGSVAEEPICGIIDFKYQSKTIVPGLIKIIEEVLNNSIDEWIRTNGQFANKIDITINSTIAGTEVTIADNGRGIPVEKAEDSYIPVLAWTKLRAGSNFSDDNRITAGTNGVGASLTNIFSTSFTGIADDGKKRLTLTCAENMSEIDYKVSPSKQRGTTVSFVPDLQKFGLSEFTKDHIDVIRDRLINMSILYKDAIKFTLNGEKIGFKNLKTIAKLFDDNAISYEEDNIQMIFAPSGLSEEFRCHSYVNAIYIKNGGSHVDYVINRIVDTLREAIQKKHKISVLPNQIRQHLLFASWINGFVNLRFDSQTKERITNSQAEVSAVLGNINYEKIAKQLLSTPEIIDPMIAAILYKKELADKQALQKLQKEQSKTNLRKISKFTDASNKTNRAECMLMLCEGDSAANAILSARTEYIGCYPLKGKPINALAASLKDVLANKEFTELLQVSGLQIGKKVESVDDLRFGKIVLLQDSDSDGKHIQGLLCALFKKYWPELFTLGIIYKFDTPIMKVEKGKDTLYFYSLSDFDKWLQNNRNAKYTARYLKGLGSSTSKDFRYYFDNTETHLTRISIEDSSDLNVVDLVFGKEAGATDKRKVWLDLEVK